MFDLGFAELVTLGIIALIVLGPEKLPRAMRTLGTYYAKFRRTISTIQAEMESELDLAETRQQMQKELAKIKQAELDMQNQMMQMRQNMRQFETQQNNELSTTSDDKNARIDISANKNITSNKDIAANKDSNALDNPSYHTSTAKDSLDEPSGTSTKAGATSITGAEFDTSENNGGVSDSDTSLMNTRPWENMWFRLGAYDKSKRLPPAPFLPNYEPDKLLNASPSLSKAVIEP